MEAIINTFQQARKYSVEQTKSAIDFNARAAKAVVEHCETSIKWWEDIFSKKDKQCGVKSTSALLTVKIQKGLVKGRIAKEERNVRKSNPRIPRKPGQPARSKKHSDLYTDENPKGTIKGLKFATREDAVKSVSKIRNSGRSKAHKIQAAIAMEQRARVMGKKDAAGVYRKYINSVKAKK